MRNFLAILGMSLACVFLLVAGVVGYYIWQLHPWVSAGKKFSLGHWRFGDCEIQVWQCKNTSVTEPFTDGLFVRQGTNQWQLFCLDIQDSYSPRIRLEEKNGQVVIYSDGENRGVYDLTAQTYQRHGQIYPPKDIDTGTNPPDGWW
jgi:hypothetical protein